MLVLYFPRYLMIAGFAVLALVYLIPEFNAMGENIDFETVLPLAIERFVPIGFKGLLLAGLLAAFMGTFAAFINSAPAYIVNDLYKKYFRPNEEQKTYIRFSYLASISLVVIGVGMGFFADSINALTLWITSALYGGYAAANVLKWIWWRFNGMGYFLGMFFGLIASTIFPSIWSDVSPIYLFPVILGFSFLGSILGTFLFAQDDMELLKTFYKKTRPWGFWGPVIQEIRKEDPDFKHNTQFLRDAFNVIIGIAWQMTLVIMPIYLLTYMYKQLLICVIIFIVSSVILKINWYDKLED